MIKRGTKGIFFITTILIMIILPILIRDPYHVDIMIMISFYGILALTWRAIMRIGQLSFGHAAFIGIGAYASALMVMKLGMSFWLALPLSGVASAAISLLIGVPTLRLKGMFFAITTWAFNEVMRSVYLIFKTPFGGANGLYAIPSPSHVYFPGLPPVSFDNKGGYCYLAFFLLLVTVLVLRRIENSRIGLVLNAIRLDDSLAESIGVNLMSHKCFTFAIGSFFAGVAGSFYAHYISYISPYSFDLTLSVNAIVFCMVGGLSSINGPLIGVSVLTVLSSLLNAAGFYKMIIFSIFLVSAILVLPDGMISLPRRVTIFIDEIRNTGQRN